MSYPFGETVFRDRAPQIQDPYHPDDPTKTVPGRYEDGTTIKLLGAFVASGSSTAVSNATRSQVLSAKSLFCPPKSDVQIGDRIRTASGTWFVNELPAADTNPFTGWQPTREVPLDGALG